jgi:hypothetical protein
MTTLRSGALIWCVLFLSPLSALATDAKGWLDACCYTTTFRLQVPGQPGEIRLRLATGNLMFNPYFVGTDWWGAEAQRCSKTGQCEELSPAKLQFQKISKRVLGNYVVEFKDGRVEGRFSAKYHHHGPLCICE